MENDRLVTPSQIRAARALLRWSQVRLATAAGLGVTTITDYENERRGWREREKQSAWPGPSGLEVIGRALENEGVRFLPSEGDCGPGVRVIAKIPTVLRWPPGPEERVPLTPSQIRAARALLGWSQTQLATAAGLGLTTITDYENEHRGWREKEKESARQGLEVIRRTLENDGVRFLPGEGDCGPGVRVIAKVPNVLCWPTRLDVDEIVPLVVIVEWRGNRVSVLVPRTVLDDLGRFRSDQPAPRHLRPYEEYRSDILQAAAAAIDAGREPIFRHVHLADSDFPQLCIDLPPASPEFDALVAAGKLLPRSRSALLRAGIVSIDAIATMTRRDLATIPGLGGRGVAAIEAVLAERSLALLTG